MSRASGLASGVGGVLWFRLTVMAEAGSEKLYSLTFEHRPQYLYAYVVGEKDNYEISRQFWQEIADHLKQTDYDRVLIEENIEESASLMDVFRLVSEIVSMGFSGIRVAFHDRKIEHNELNEFGALVASNRGLNARVFNDGELAERWITSP